MGFAFFFGFVRIPWAMVARRSCWVQCWLLSSRRLASNAMRIARARPMRAPQESDAAALPVQCSVQSSLPLQLAACAVIDRCRRLAAASNQYGFARTHELHAASTASTAPSLHSGSGSRPRRRRALWPEPLTTTSEASGLNPHLDKVVVRRRRHIGVQIPPTPGRRQPPRPQLTTAARRCPRRPWRTTSGRREAAPYPT